MEQYVRFPNCRHWRVTSFNFKFKICRRCSKKNPEFLQKYFRKLYKNPQFFSLFGHIISDGSTQITKINYSNKEPLLIEEVKFLIQNIFKMIPSVLIRKDGIIMIDLYSKHIALFFLNTEKNNILPKTKKSQSLFLRACFDDEGHISKKGIISITQSNKAYIDNIEFLLNSFKIKSIQYSMFDKRYNKTYFCLRISTKYNKLFYKKIGFLHPFKNQRIVDWVDNH